MTYTCTNCRGMGLQPEPAPEDEERGFTLMHPCQPCTGTGKTGPVRRPAR